VRADRTDTIGEFDFLLNDGDHLVHIEFATKFYLLDANSTSADFNGLIGPNLADYAGRQDAQDLRQQLSLARHPAAQACCRCRWPARRRWSRAGCSTRTASADAGITRQHCHGFWMTQAQAQACRSSSTPSCRACNGWRR
jgi:hypothetical protein